MDEASQGNSKTLAYLKKRSCLRPALAEKIPPISDASGRALFTHPEVLERVWGTLGASLPEDCRAIVHGTTVLRNPKSGLIFVIGLGTFYWLQAPPEVLMEFQANERHFVRKMSNGQVIDVRQELGVGWVYGGWLEAELDWCVEAYKKADEGREYGAANG